MSRSQVAGAARLLAVIDCASTWSAFTGATLSSAVPWITMLGTGRARSPMAAWAARPCAMGSSAPLAIAVKAVPMLSAERYERPECTATAANRSGYTAARIAAMAPPADRPATKTRRGSIVHDDAVPMSSRTIATIDAGSPALRVWCWGRNQFQQPWGLSPRSCWG
jgi:hypothetical protein